MNEHQKSAQIGKLVVLGTSHQLQGTNFLRSIDDECYRDLVEQLILEHKIDFIFEEAAGRVPTHAETLAKALAEPIRHMDLDPSKDEREKHGLSRETGGGYVVDLWQAPPCIGRVEHVDEHAAREEFWLKRIRGEGFSSGLVICGQAHSLSFAFRLSNAGFEVENCIEYMPYARLCGHAEQTNPSPRFLLTSGPDDWRKLLADPEKHWRSGYSARTLAHCWEATNRFPPEVSDVLTQTTEPLLAKLTPILAVPEFKVPLPGGGRASQNDVFVLGRSSAGPVCIMVEGKVNESFGPTLDEWRAGASPGKEERLDFLLRTLRLSDVPRGDIRYQLFHRTVSAIITGEQYRAVAAIVLIHSFSSQRTGWADYEAFIGLFGVKAVPDVVQRLTSVKSNIPLFAAWVTGDSSFLGR
jgi:hypothetical protein